MLGRPSRATIAAACLALALALATTALAWMSPDPRKVHDGKLGISAGGAMSIEDSRDEAAILTALALAPGHAALGTVTIRNHGDDGYLVLSLRKLAEVPGANGASLRDALALRIRDMGAPRHPLVYAGPLATMPPLRLGLVRSAARRRYRFVASLPEPGFVDDSLIGAGARFDFRWRLNRSP
jgi:hypothetical protein